MFKRLGLPEWLITQTADEYVACAIRLAENHEERLALRRHIIENNGLKTLFTGDPRPMGRVLLQKLQEWADANEFELTPPANIGISTTSKNKAPTKKPATKKTTTSKKAVASSKKTTSVTKTKTSK